jgi:tetratricopeptide (TPR) repeat protein
MALHELQRYGEALLFFERNIQLEPHHSLAYLGKSGTLMALGRSEEASLALEFAIQLDPAFFVRLYSSNSDAGA